MTLQIATLLIALTALFLAVVAGLRLEWRAAQEQIDDLCDRLEWLSVVVHGGWDNRIDEEIPGLRERMNVAEGELGSLKMDLKKVALTADEVKAKLILRREASDRINAVEGEVDRLKLCIKEIAARDLPVIASHELLTMLENRLHRLEGWLTDEPTNIDSDTSRDEPPSIVPDATGDSIADDGFVSVPLEIVGRYNLVPIEGADLPEPAFSPADDNAHASNDGLEPPAPMQRFATEGVDG